VAALSRPRTSAHFRLPLIEGGIRIVGIENHSNTRGAGRDLLHDLQPLAEDREFKNRKSRDVSPGSRKALRNACFERITGSRYDDRDRASELHQNRNDAAAKRDNEVGLELQEIYSIGPHQIHIIHGPTFVELNVAAPRPPKPCKLFAKSLNASLNFHVSWRVRHQNPDPAHPLALLCARRERPRSRRAAEKRDELASFHSISSSRPTGSAYRSNQ
jgi:hypothetical protein